MSYLVLLSDSSDSKIEIRKKERRCEVRFLFTFKGRGVNFEFSLVMAFVLFYPLNFDEISHR